MKRLIEKTVFSGFVTCWRLAGTPDQALAGLRERDDRWRRAAALAVGDDRGLTTLEHRHAGVGGAEVDPDCLSHLETSCRPAIQENRCSSSFQGSSNKI